MLKEILEDCSIIAAVKEEEGLQKSLASDSRIVFLLYGDICSIGEIVHTVKSAGKLAMVHMDLIAGLGNKEISVDFIRRHTEADGIITTRPAFIRRAKELGLLTVQRFFVIDSMAFEQMEKQTSVVRPDCIEVLPGVMPKVIARICRTVRVPVIAGGLIADKEDIMAALSAGAISVSTTRESVWFL